MAEQPTGLRRHARLLAVLCWLVAVLAIGGLGLAAAAATRPTPPPPGAPTGTAPAGTSPTAGTQIGASGRPSAAAAPVRGSGPRRPADYPRSLIWSGLTGLLIAVAGLFVLRNRRRQW